MERDWVKVFSTDQSYKAEIAKSLLEDDGIQAVVINKKDTLYKSFGEVELYVKRDYVLQAKKLLSKSEL